MLIFNDKNVNEDDFVKFGDWTSKFFKYKEFQCKDGNKTVIMSETTIKKLEQLRKWLGSPILITSAYRTVTHNASVGGGKSSQHLKGTAVDIKINGYKSIEVGAHARALGFTGIGLYNTFTHIDTRTSGNTQWKGGDYTGPTDLSKVNLKPKLKDTDELMNTAIEDMVIYGRERVSKPTCGVVGGEWVIFGLTRFGESTKDTYYENYYKEIEDIVKEKKGVIDRTKYTEHSRVILALSAMGKEPDNVGGYNLITPLGDYNKTIVQGINGPICALIALDSKAYPVPKNDKAKVQATKEVYIQKILDNQLDDGGWSFSGKIFNPDMTADPDMTAMALQALSIHRARTGVSIAVEKGVSVLSKLQNDKGGFSSYGVENSESCVQVIVALTSLGISLEDERFIKKGNTLIDNLLTFYVKENGFKHAADGNGNNQMASEQAFYGLIAAKRARAGKSSLYSLLS